MLFKSKNLFYLLSISKTSFQKSDITYFRVKKCYYLLRYYIYIFIMLYIYIYIYVYSFSLYSSSLSKCVKLLTLQQPLTRYGVISFLIKISQIQGYYNRQLHYSCQCYMSKLHLTNQMKFELLSALLVNVESMLSFGL